MAGNSSSAKQIVGGSHLFAPLGTPPATSPALAASPLADGDSSGWAGTLRQGCTWLGIPCTVWQQGPWILGVQTRTLVLWSISRVKLQLWLTAHFQQSQELAKPAVRVLVLLHPPQGRGPLPWLRTAPTVAWEALSRRHRCVRPLEWFFSHKTELKKEMRSGLFCGWDSLWRAASCLPLLCCNTGNLLLLTPGVVSNSQMVLTSISSNWWPTCLTL